MKLLIVGALMGMAVPAPAETSADALGWLAGRWESLEGERWTEEYWSAPRGGSLIGFSRSGAQGTTREFEFLRIAPGEDGGLAYLASPGGRPSVAFRLIDQDGRSVTFAAPGHDYPQRIRYALEGDTLTATISASDGSRARRWTYRRVD